MSAPTSKPVHPCITSVFDGSRGAEYSTWAHLTTRPPECPNLVTGQASTIRVYTLDEETGKLFETYVFSNLAGNICYLQTLRASDYHGGEISKDSKNVIRDRDNLPNTSYGDDDDQKHADALLLGFCGHPRLTVVSLTHQADSASSPALLSATCLMDLTQALIDSSFGSVTPLEHDLVAATGARKNNDGATVAVILGAGVAVAVIDLQRSSRSGWIAHEPYLLPLPSLSASIKRSHSANSQAQSSNPASAAAASAVTNTNIASIATGFGDILSATFLAGYIEPTLVLLHSNPNQHGRTWIGRMGRPHWQPGTRHGLLVTAFSVTVAHKRSAILWSVEVPADARSLYPVGKSGCLVLCTNSLLSINNAGRIDDFLGVNGFVKSTCPTSLLEILKPNPKPFPKLSTQLDGAALSFCTENTVLLSLRSGRLYLLQLPSSDPAERNGQSRMSLLPMGRTLGAIGSVSSLVAWPLATAGQELFDKLGTKMIGGGTDKAKEKLSMGLLFAGSRLGDSSLLGYVLEYLTVPWEGDEESDTKRIKHDDATTDANAETAISQPGLQRSETKSCSLLDEIPYRVSPEMDEILRLEEEALYAPTNVDNQADSNVVPPSDEEDAREHLPPLQSSSNMTMKPSQSGSSVTTKRKLPPVSETVILRALTSLDSLVGLGPLGPSCEGPIAYPDVQTSFSTGVINPATALIMPCGYGSSGGLCILTAPGRDERHILAEEDCLEVQSMFSLRNHNLVFLGMKSGMGVRVLRLNQGEAAGQSEKPENEKLDNSDLSEVSVDEWCKPSKKKQGKDTPSASELFSNAALLACADFVDGSFMLVMSYPKDRENPKDFFYGGAVLKDVSGTLEVLASFSLPSQDGNGALNSIAPMAIDKDNFGKPVMLLACCWSSGLANLVAVDNSGIIKNVEIPVSEGGMQPMDEDDDDDDDSDHAINAFYSSTRVVAVDLFCVPANYFEGPSEHSEKSKEDFEGSKQTKSSTTSDMELLLAGDQDLYYVSDHSDSSGNDQTLMKRGAEGTESWKDEALFLGVCRQSGSLQVFSVSDFLLSTKDQVAVWACEGCGLGAMSLCSNGEHRTPKQHEVCVREMRFFFCGPSAEPGDQNNLSPSRPLCLSLETSNGDLIVYSAENRSNPSLELRFNRAPLKLIARESQEQTRFRAKLRRKGIVSSSVDADESYFRYNRLNRFTSLSEQDGLFAATCRPVWVVAERGKPQAIVHRSRHVAPAGGKSRPVTGFCADLDGEGGFMTLHERVGSVGSQRLTLYRRFVQMILFSCHMPSY